MHNYAWIVNCWIVIIGSCIVNYTNPYVNHVILS